MAENRNSIETAKAIMKAWREEPLPLPLGVLEERISKAIESAGSNALEASAMLVERSEGMTVSEMAHCIRGLKEEL